MWKVLSGVFFANLVVPLWAADFCLNVTARTPCAGKTTAECASYGCCWDAQSEPSCFFQTPKYYVRALSNTTNGLTMTLAIDGEGDGGKYPGSPISPLQVDLIQETSSRLHIKITDPNNERWEIPESILPTSPPPAKPVTYPYYQYQVPRVGQEFFFAVSRRYSSNSAVFNTSSVGFIYANQLLQIGTTFTNNDHIYGFGEHTSTLQLNTGRKETYTLWNYDGGTPDHLNLYGSHPFYLGLEQDGSAHGVFLRSSNGMDIDIANNYLKYNVIGGILDFYIFIGSRPDDVMNQYQEVIGRPAMPPYWALGYHQCRWGYKDLQEVKDVVNNFAKEEIPLDTVWTDIDYMDEFKDFTTDPVNFPTAAMSQFIEEVHENGQHYVLITDPAISITKGYKPYDDGVSMNIFIKDRNDAVFVGKIMAGEVAFPDFAYPLTTEYWTKQITPFLKDLPVDGLWLDMNEPSNFCNGACKPASSDTRISQNFEPISPPYTIGNRREEGSNIASPLNEKTLDMDVKHHGGAIAYNMHNLFGLTESMATRQALISARQGKRPFVLSRSTFPGSGAHAAHWLGGTPSTAEDLRKSIHTILSFQIFGVPLVGADICGFAGDTTEELCARWMELGSFYPFARNHNSKTAASQEPYRWPSVAAISRKYLGIRYSLLPYYYTLFFGAHHDPSDYLVYPSYGAVLRPLFFDFGSEFKAAVTDEEFLVGGALLVAPQLNIGLAGKEMDVYFPQDVWYDWYTHELVSDGSAPKLLTNVQTPLDFVPMYVRGGFIIPMQGPGLTTTESRKNPYSLLVALNSGNADGGLYLDDGETYNTSEYTYISYSCHTTELSTYVSGTKYATKAGLPLLRNVTVLGVLNRPSVVALDGVPQKFTFIEGKSFKLVVTDLTINMDSEFHLNWM